MTGAVSLVTPTYHGDFEACQLLCDSIDRWVTGYDKHYLVVSDSDAAMFAPFGTGRRIVVPESNLLPGAVFPLPGFLKWKGRQYYWGSGLGWPVYGWHLQQLRKFAMAVRQDCPRVMCIDSDNCFVRPFDVGITVGGGLSPLYSEVGGVNDSRPSHVRWQANAHALLGAGSPKYPGNDYVGQMIVWERASVSAILQRIEQVSGVKWWQALCRIRHFSEYMTYGIGIEADPVLSARHAPVHTSFCHTYWSGAPLDEDGLRQLVGNMEEHQVAISVQSHTRTDPALMRKVAFEPAR